MLSSPCFQYNSQDLNVMLLNSRMFLIELSTFMTPLAALAFHLALLLNCCRFGLGFFFPLPGARIAHANVSNFFAVCV